MKNIIKFASSIFPCVLLLFMSCTENHKDIKPVSLVPVYSLEVSVPNASDNTTSGYTSIETPSDVTIYREKDLVIQYHSGDSGTLNYIPSSDDSTEFIPNPVDPTLSGTPGAYDLGYTIEKEIITDAENGVETNETLEYLVNADTTNDMGEALDPITGFLTITSTKVIVTTVAKADGDVSIPEVIVESTDTHGEIRTVVDVDEVNKVTTVTIVSVVKCVTEVVENEIYN